MFTFRAHNQLWTGHRVCEGNGSEIERGGERPRGIAGRINRDLYVNRREGERVNMGLLSVGGVEELARPRQ